MTADVARAYDSGDEAIAREVEGAFAAAGHSTVRWRAATEAAGGRVAVLLGRGSACPHRTGTDEPENGDTHLFRRVRGEEMNVPVFGNIEIGVAGGTRVEAPVNKRRGWDRALAR